jgi:hypothetical protein
MDSPVEITLPELVTTVDINGKVEVSGWVAAVHVWWRCSVNDSGNTLKSSRDIFKLSKITDIEFNVGRCVRWLHNVENSNGRAILSKANLL